MATTNVYIVFYSLYGHVETMAREIQKGANSVDGVKATLWQVPETLPERVLEKMNSHPKADDVPVISPEQLLEADGFLFGSPSRFGVMAAQMKAFFDATHPLWATQALAGKPAGIFWSTGFHGGGQELTARLVRWKIFEGNGIQIPWKTNYQENRFHCLVGGKEFTGNMNSIVWLDLEWLTAITQLAHHGMIFVPVGYTFGSGMFEMNEVRGGSSYGAGTYAADGSRQPTELELQQAFHQGKYTAEITKKLKTKT